MYFLFPFNHIATVIPIYNIRNVILEKNVFLKLE